MTKVMQQKNKATAKQVVATEIYKYIRQLAARLLSLGEQFYDQTSCPRQGVASCSTFASRPIADD